MARIAYLMSHYPAKSHAFVLREVEHLRAAAVDLETLPTHPRQGRGPPGRGRPARGRHDLRRAPYTPDERRRLRQEGRRKIAPEYDVAHSAGRMRAALEAELP